MGTELPRRHAVKRRLMMLLWRAMNPAVRHLAGVAPWWIVLETTGARSGRPRQSPLARGPIAGNELWLISAHGRHASWVRNVARSPRVRVRLRRRWQEGTAHIVDLDRSRLRAFNFYARGAAGAIGIDPCMVRIDLD
jgi:deazaflavin-dependent oxidoreductase (nitroreductase family)